MAIERMLTEAEPVGDLIGRVLHEAGIEYVFGISGGHTGRIITGLSKYQNSVRMITVREESLAGVMAEVYGRLTRRPGVLIGQGPWVLGNGLIGTMEAYLSSSPMLLLTDFSDATPFHLHAPYQQATGDYGSWDARRAFGGVTKQVMQAHTPVAAVQATQLAIKHATAGQPGPVTVLFSMDSLTGEVEPDSQPILYPTHYYLPPAPPPADKARVAVAAEALLGAVRPVIIAGNGVRIAQAYSTLAALAEATGAPVVTTAAGKGVFPEIHPLALGVFGTFGTAAANAAVSGADLILAIGTKLGPSDTAWENRDLLDPTRQTFIQIDIEPKNASWTFPAEHVLVGDAAIVLTQMLETVASKSSGRRDAGRVACRRPAPGARLFQSPRLYRRRCAAAAATGHRRVDAHAAARGDRDLRCRREPHPDDAFLPDETSRRLSAGCRLRPDGLCHSRGNGCQAGSPRSASDRGVRRRRLRDDDERIDDRARA